MADEKKKGRAFAKLQVEATLVRSCTDLCVTVRKIIMIPPPAPVTEIGVQFIISETMIMGPSVKLLVKHIDQNHYD